MTLHEDWYRKLAKLPRDAQKPSFKLLETCLLTEDNKKGSTDEEIRIILARWKGFSLLRGLYVDDKVSEEFDRFRAAFASGLTREKGVTIVPPSLDDASIKTSHVNRVQFTQNSRFVGDFKAMFHRIVCLHSMAIVCLQFAKRSTFEPSATGPKQEDANVVEMMNNLGFKKEVLACGKTSAFDLDTQLDGLEVYNFLHMFLLRKIAPLQGLWSRIENDTGDRPLRWYPYVRYIRKGLDSTN